MAQIDTESTGKASGSEAFPQGSVYMPMGELNSV